MVHKPNVIDYKFDQHVQFDQHPLKCLTCMFNCMFNSLRAQMFDLHV